MNGFYVSVSIQCQPLIRYVVSNGTEWPAEFTFITEGLACFMFTVVPASEQQQRFRLNLE